MWNNKSVSLVFSTYNEKDSINAAIRDFQSSGCIDEIIVVNNNAAPGTDEEVKKTTARLVHEPRQGFGFSIQKGLREAKGDLIIISEPDGTFSGHDVLKLLAYSEDFDMVLGTRTTTDMIWEGAYMGFPLRLGNYLVAKLLETLFDTLMDKFKVTGSCFNPEMVMAARVNGVRFIEIPVNYKRRVGKSMGTKNIFNAVFLGMKMIWLILTYRMKTIGR